MKSLVEYFLSKSIFVNLLTFLIILIGGFTAVKMNREAFPNINFDIVSVVTVFPGASPAEIEKLITKPLEEAIKEVDGIKEFRSASIENRSGIVITLDPDSKNTQKVVDDIKSAIDRVEDLPEEAEDPLVAEITTSRQPVIEIDISLKSNDSSVEAEKTSQSPGENRRTGFGGYSRRRQNFQTRLERYGNAGGHRSHGDVFQISHKSGHHFCIKKP